MPKLQFEISTKDTSSKTLNNVANSFGRIKGSVDIAKSAVKAFSGGVSMAMTGLNSAFSLLKMGFNAAKKIVDLLSKSDADFKKSIDDFKSSVMVVVTTIAKNITPVFIEITNAIKNFLSSAKGIDIISKIAGGIATAFELVKNIISTVGKAFLDSLKPIGDAAKELLNTAGISANLTTALTILKPIIISIAVVFNTFAQVIVSVINNVKTLVNLFKEVGDFFSFLKKGDFSAAKKALDGIRNGTLDLLNPFDDLGKIIDSNIKTVKKLDKAIDPKKLASELDSTFSTVSATTQKNLESSLKAYEKVNDEIVNDNQDKNNEIIKQENQMLETVKGSWNKWKGVRDNTLNAVSNTLTGVQDISAQIANEITKSTIGAVSSILKQVGQLKEAIENGVTKPIKSIKELVIASISGVLSISQSVVTSVFSYLSGETDKTLAKIEKDYNDLSETLEKNRQKSIDSIDADMQKQLEAIGMANQTELEMAEEKLAQLEELRQAGYDAETEARIEKLEEYEAAIQGQTDYEIEKALERQRAKILETEAKKQADIQEKISLQKKEIEKAKILEAAEKKKKEIETKYATEKAKAEKEKNTKFNEEAKKQFESNKANQISNVWIQAGIGIATAWASAMSLGPIAGPIVAGVLTTLLTTNAGVQTGLIAAQNYVNQYATGGKTTQNELAMVGEAGRELVRLPKGSTIYNNDTTERMIDKSDGNIIIQNDIYLDSELITRSIVQKRKSTILRYV